MRTRAHTESKSCLGGISTSKIPWRTSQIAPVFQVEPMFLGGTRMQLFAVPRLAVYVTNFNVWYERTKECYMKIEKTLLHPIAPPRNARESASPLSCFSSPRRG